MRAYFILKQVKFPLGMPKNKRFKSHLSLQPNKDGRWQLSFLKHSSIAEVALLYILARI
jgi:hypothetical protein